MQDWFTIFLAYESSVFFHMIRQQKCHTVAKPSFRNSVKTDLRWKPELPQGAPRPPTDHQKALIIEQTGQIVDKPTSADETLKIITYPI